MKALPISDKDFSVVVNKFDKFGLGYVRRVGNSIRIKPYNSFISDERNETVEFAIYLHETGYCWRRYTASGYWNNVVNVYQMFRTCKGRKYNNGYLEWTPNTHYVWEHFATVEEAINRFEQYGIRNGFYYTE